jgi:hypothetical protein
MRYRVLTGTRRIAVTISPYFIFLRRKHFITEKNSKNKSGEVKDSVFFPPLFLLHKLHNPMLPPCPPPRPHARTQNLYSPFALPLAPRELKTHPSNHSLNPPIHPSTHPPIRQSPYPPIPRTNLKPTRLLESLRCACKLASNSTMVKSILNSASYKQVVKRLNAKTLYYYIQECLKCSRYVCGLILETVFRCWGNGVKTKTQEICEKRDREASLEPASRLGAMPLT